MFCDLEEKKCTRFKKKKGKKKEKEKKNNIAAKSAKVRMKEYLKICKHVK